MPDPDGAVSRETRSRAAARRARARHTVATRAFLVVLVVVAVALARSGDGSLVPSSPAGASLTGLHEYVVRPGDTLWSIAERVEPGRDPRPLVAVLAGELDGAVLQPGQSLRLP